MAKLLIDEVDNLSGQPVELCYHCHKCSAGCPFVGAMQYGPDRIMRMISLEERQALLSSRDIWLCSGCFTCATRCPNELDISAVIDALRQMAIREGYQAGERDALLFHRLFVGTVHRLGRSHEALMLGLFKILSRTPFLQDMHAGARLFFKGKIPLLPDDWQVGNEIRQIFRKVE